MLFLGANEEAFLYKMILSHTDIDDRHLFLTMGHKVELITAAR